MHIYIAYPATSLVVMEIHQAPAVLAAASLVPALPLAHVDERLGEPASAEADSPGVEPDRKSVRVSEGRSLAMSGGVTYRGTLDAVQAAAESAISDSQVHFANFLAALARAARD